MTRVGGGVGSEVVHDALAPMLVLQPRKPSTVVEVEDERAQSIPGDELRAFRSCLRWMCVEQSGVLRALFSWSLFLVLAVVVPVTSHFVLSYSPQRRAYDVVVELSLTSAAAISFLCLSGYLRRYGLRRFLFVDKLGFESERVQIGYMTHLNRSFRLLSFFVLPCFAAECAYKVWWYCVGADRIPFLGNPVASDVVACTLELASWIYRTAIFFLVCVLFRLICYLQIRRLQEFAASFDQKSEVETVLIEHLRIRRQLKVMSHRFRAFIISCLILVTASQFAALLLTTRSHAAVSFFNTGELGLWSIVLVTGLLICLRSAAKITHQAQAITSHAAKWHVCSTVETYEDDPEMLTQHSSNCVHPVSDVTDDSDYEELMDEEDDLDSTNLVKPHAHTISFQKRQALVTYLENNRAGITVFGFVMDRTWLHTIFMMELTLVLWLLSKTIWIS